MSTVGSLMFTKPVQIRVWTGVNVPEKWSKATKKKKKVWEWDRWCISVFMRAISGFNRTDCFSLCIPRPLLLSVRWCSGLPTTSKLLLTVLFKSILGHNWAASLPSFIFLVCLTDLDKNQRLPLGPLCCDCTESSTLDSAVRCLDIDRTGECALTHHLKMFHSEVPQWSLCQNWPSTPLQACWSSASGRWTRTGSSFLLRCPGSLS